MRPILVFLERLFSTRLCFWNASIGPGNLVLRLPMPLWFWPRSPIFLFGLDLQSAAQSWRASKPRYFSNSGWRFPPSGRHRGREGYAVHRLPSENATWSSEILAKIISHRNHCSKRHQQTDAQEAESDSPSPHPIISLSKSQSSSDRRSRTSGIDHKRRVRGVSRPPWRALIAAKIAKCVTSWYLAILVLSASSSTFNLEGAENQINLHCTAQLPLSKKW